MQFNPYCIELHITAHPLTCKVGVIPAVVFAYFFLIW